MQRVVGAHLLGRRSVLHRAEPGQPVGGGEALGEQSGGVGPVVVRARPEDAVRGVDPVPADPRVVGDAAGRGPAQLGEDHARVRPPPPRSVGRPPSSRWAARAPGDQQVSTLAAGRRGRPGSPGRADAGRRRTQRPAAQHPSFQVGHRAVLLGPLGGGQHHVGQRRRLGEQEVGDDKQVQVAQAALDPGGPGCGDHRVRAEHQQRPWPLVGAERVEQLIRRHARPGQLVGGHPPDPRDVGAASRSSILRYPGSWSAFCPCSRPPWPLPCPVRQP